MRDFFIWEKKVIILVQSIMILGIDQEDKLLKKNIMKMVHFIYLNLKF